MTSVTHRGKTIIAVALISALLIIAVTATVIIRSRHNASETVWVNLYSNVYHEPDDPWYGKTRAGAFMSKSAALARHARPSRHWWH